MIGKLAGLGMAEGAKDGVSALFADEVHEEVNREIPEWLRTFPNDESWNLIERAVIENWIKFDLNAAVGEVSLMPEGETRERLAPIAASALAGKGMRDAPEFGRLIGLISDPGLLKCLEPDESADPFAE